MLISAGWATGLPGYGRLPAILAEARVFQLAAVVAGFEALRAGVRAVSDLLGFLVVGLGSGLG